MASTIYSYNLTGGKVFPVAFEYLARRFVKITLIGATRQELQLNVDYRFISKTEIETTIVWGTGEFQTIEVRRVTSATDRLVNFTDGSILRSQDLNISQIQAIHIAEEGRDVAENSMLGTGFSWDALGLPIKNVGYPLLATDAPNVQYVLDKISTTLRGNQSETISEIPADRANKVLAFDANRQPIAIDPSAGSSMELEIQLRDPVGDGNGAEKIGRAAIALSSVASLKAILPREDMVYILHAYVKGTGQGGGIVRWDPLSTLTADDVVVFASTRSASGRFIREITDGIVRVEFSGTLSGTPASQKALVEKASDCAKSLGMALHFKSGAVYNIDSAVIRCKNVHGNGCSIMKTASSTLGIINWGDKPNTMTDGFLGGFTLDGNGKDNVVNLRMFGNHERPKVRGMVLKDCDFYAFAIGGLSGQGDKDDVINGLDIDGVYIESNRGNTRLGTTYSFGLEFFPGKICRDWTIRNVHTKGKIINKVHSVIGLDLDDTTFEAPVAFNSLSSGYCELNNCQKVTIGKGSVFDANDHDTYLALLIGGSRVSGGQPVTDVTMSGKVYGRMAVEKVTSISFTADAEVSRELQLYNETGRIMARASKFHRVITPQNSSGSVKVIEFTGVIMDGPFRFEGNTTPIGELIVDGGIINSSVDQTRLNNVGLAVFKGTTFKMNGTVPLAYCMSAKNSIVKLHGIIMDGGNVWNRPLFAIDATGKFELYYSVFTRFTSDILLSSGSAQPTANIGTVINGQTPKGAVSYIATV